MFSPEVCVTFWKGHSIPLPKSIMKSWGKRKVKVQRGTNLPLYIAIMSNFNPSCVLLPNVFPRGLYYFLEGPYYDPTKKYNEVLEKCKVKVQRGPNLPLYIANKYNFDPSCILLPNVFPRGLCYFLERPYYDLTKKYNEVLGKM